MQPQTCSGCGKAMSHVVSSVKRAVVDRSGHRHGKSQRGRVVDPMPHVVRGRSLSLTRPPKQVHGGEDRIWRRKRFESAQTVAGVASIANLPIVAVQKLDGLVDQLYS